MRGVSFSSIFVRSFALIIFFLLFGIFFALQADAASLTISSSGSYELSQVGTGGGGIGGCE